MKKLLASFIMVTMLAGAAFALPPIEIDDGKYLRIFYEGQFGLAFRDTGSGPERDDATYDFNFRRNRLGFIGTYNEWLSFYFQTEYIENRKITPLSVNISDTGDNFYVLDAQIRFTPANAFNIFLGKLKNNLTRENLEACFEPLSFDRSVFVYSPYKTSRDVGVAFWGNLADDKLQYRVDAMNGRSGGTTADPMPSNSLRYTARLHASIFDAESNYGYAGTYLGEKQVLTVGASIQYEPEVVYADTVNMDDEKDYMAYSFDLFYEQPIGTGAVTVSAAYLNVSFDEAYREANPGASSYGLNGEKNGFYVKAGYLLPVDVGPGKIQVFGRYDDFKFANLNNNATDFIDQKVSRIGAGVNYYIFGQNLKVTAEYSLTNFDEEDSNDPNYQNFNSFDLYLQARF
jgi:hypothetical protein